MTIMFKQGLIAAAAAVGLVCGNQVFAEEAVETEADEVAAEVVAEAATAPAAAEVDTTSAAPAANPAPAATPAAAPAKPAAPVMLKPWWMPKSAKIGFVGMTVPKMGDSYNAVALTGDYLAARKLAYPGTATITRALADYPSYNLTAYSKETGGLEVGATWALNKDFDAEITASYVPRRNLGFSYAVVMPSGTNNSIAAVGATPAVPGANIHRGINLSTGSGTTSPTGMDGAVTTADAASGLQFAYKYADIKATVLFNLAGNELFKPYIGGGLTLAKFGSIRDVRNTNGTTFNRMLFAYNELKPYAGTTASNDTFYTAGPVGSIEFKDKQTFGFHITAGVNVKLWEKSGLNFGVDYSRTRNELIITRNAYQIAAASGTGNSAINPNVGNRPVPKVTVAMPIDYAVYKFNLSWVKEF